jgi:hypothetical protein
MAGAFLTADKPMSRTARRTTKRAVLVTEPLGPPSSPIVAVPKPTKSKASPILVAKFDDGVQVRLSIYCDIDRLDLPRGIAVARAAHSSRVKTPMPLDATCMTEARFETADGATLATYTAEDLTKAVMA